MLDQLQLDNQGMVKDDRLVSKVRELKGSIAKQKAPAQKKAATIVKEGGLAARKAVKDALAGINALFGDTNTLRSGPAFDEEMYRKAKPHFVSAWLDVKDVGYSVKELVRYFYDNLGKKIRPYLERFVNDLKDDNLEIQPPNKDLTEGPQDTTVESQGGGTDASKQKQGDISGSIRKDGDTAETDSAGTLDGLAPEGSKTAEGGRTPAGGSAEGGDAGTQGDRRTPKGRVSKPRGGGGGSSKVHTSAAGKSGKGGTGKNQQPGGNTRVLDAPQTIPAVNFVITDEVGLGKGGEPEEDQSPFVMVDDNYHYMDGDSRYTAGKFDTWEEALALAKEIVDEAVIPAINDGLIPEDAIMSYRHFGEDPWIIGNGAVPEGEHFSAWEYAEKRAFQLYALKNRIHEESDNE